MTRVIKLDLLTIIALILILVGGSVLIVAYYSIENNKCVGDPINYANKNNESYYWDSVYPVNYPRY